MLRERLIKTGAGVIEHIARIRVQLLPGGSTVPPPVFDLAHRVMFSRWRPPIGFGLSASIRPCHKPCARGSPCSTKRPSPLQSPAALLQQYHLDALTLRRKDFPAQRGIQLSDLALGTLDHLVPRIR
jgi:hypothetical protein